MEEGRNNAAIAAPIKISGQGEARIATAPAATNTPRFETTSFREHSNVLDMFTSRDRKRHSSRRHARFATSATPPNASIRFEDGGTPLLIFITTLTTIPAPRAR